MRKSIGLILNLLVLLFSLTSAHAILVSFSDKDFLNGASWGTMDIAASAANTLQVRYGASPSSIIPTSSQVTGFGFTFIPSNLVADSVTNPANDLYMNDRGDLKWIKLKNLNAIPNPSNADQFAPAVSKADYFFGVTEGNANNIPPPGYPAGPI
jgi:hypothetical protein